MLDTGLVIVIVLAKKMQIAEIPNPCPKTQRKSLKFDHEKSKKSEGN